MAFLTAVTLAVPAFALLLGIVFSLTPVILIALLSMIVGAALHQIGRPATSISPGADHWTRRPTHVNPALAERLTSPLAIVIGIVLIFAALIGVNALLH